MVILSQVVDMLSKLGFSFWQLILLLAIYIFRGDVSRIIRRASKFKFGPGEVELGREDHHVSDLVDLRSNITDKKLEREQIEINLNEKIRRRTIGALINIKNNTSFLWRGGFKNNSSIETSDVRYATFKRVRQDLGLLEELKHIKVSKQEAYQAYDGDGVFKVKITLLSDQIKHLIDEADDY